MIGLPLNRPKHGMSLWPPPLNYLSRRSLWSQVRLLVAHRRAFGSRLSQVWRSASRICSGSMPRLPARDVCRLLLQAEVYVSILSPETDLADRDSRCRRGLFSCRASASRFDHSQAFATGRPLRPQAARQARCLCLGVPQGGSGSLRRAND